MHLRFLSAYLFGFVCGQRLKNKYNFKRPGEFLAGWEFRGNGWRFLCELMGLPLKRGECYSLPWIFRLWPDFHLDVDRRVVFVVCRSFVDWQVWQVRQTCHCEFALWLNVLLSRLLTSASLYFTGRCADGKAVAKYRLAG